MVSKKKPKILFILTLPPPLHGANIANEALWNSEVRQAFDSILLDISDHRDVNNLGKLDPVNVTLALKSMVALCSRLLKERLDLAYLLISQNNLAFFRDGLYILLIKAISKKTRVLIHLHGSNFKRFYKNTHWFMKRFIDFTLKRVDAAIVLGDSLKPILTDWIKEVHVVPNGTDIRFSLDKKRKGHNENEIVLFLSNLAKSKGVADVVKSAVYVTREYPQVIYKMAGMWKDDSSFNVRGDALQKEVTEIIQSNGIENSVQFLGVVSGKAKEELLLNADIFVLPSYCEGQPKSIIEAMAAGCPVISTRTGAIPETVMDNKTGFLIDPGNPEMLTDRIIRLIEDKNLCHRMGMAARIRYQALYTQEHFIANMMGVFKDVLAH
ncbi:MAG: glycosyltransferase family 4 protein [bacterium]